MKKLILLLFPVLLSINITAQNWQLVADTSFGVMGPNSFDLYTLDTARNYKMVISGSFSEGGGEWYDVHYQYAPVFSDFGYNYFIASPSWLVNLPATPAGYQLSHVYELYFPGDGSVIHFSFTDNGYTDNAGTMYFELYQECPVANHPFTSDTSVCGNQGIVLIADSATNYIWYDSPTGGNILSNDDSLLIGSIAQTDTFYVSTMHYLGCESNRDTVIVTANPLPTVTFNLPPADDSTCTSHAPFLITGEFPAGGIFSGTGVNGNMFDPSIAGPGTHTISYSYTDNNGCNNVGTQQIYVDVCTGITSSDFSSVLYIIPNPNNGIFKIQLPEGKENATVEIMNVLGEIVYTGTVSEKNSSVDMNETASGIYVIRVVMENQVATSTFIRQ